MNSSEIQSSGPTCIEQFIHNKAKYRLKNDKEKCPNIESIKSVASHDKDICDISQMQYLARKIGAWRAVEICSRIPMSVEELKIHDHPGTFFSSIEDQELNTVTGGLGENSSAFSIFGFSGLHEESLATLSILDLISSLFEIDNADQELNGNSNDIKSDISPSINSKLISRNSFHSAGPSDLSVDQSLKLAASTKNLILSPIVTIKHKKSKSLENIRVDSSNVDNNGISAAPENDCTFTYVGNLLYYAFKENWRNRLKEFKCSDKSTPEIVDVASSIKVVRDALTTVIAITAGSMSEFDAFHNGWRTGVSGGGISIEVRLQSRMETVKGLIRTLNLSWFLHVQDHGEENSPSFKIFEGYFWNLMIFPVDVHLLLNDIATLNALVM